MISNSHWTYLGNTLVIGAQRNMPETVALQGSWTRKDLQGNVVGTVSVTTTNGTVYDITLPAAIVGAESSWTQSGIGAQTWTAHTGTHQFFYDTDKIITFLEWGYGGNGPPVIRFRETQGVPVTTTLFWAFDGQKFVEETAQVSHHWIPPQGFHPVGSLPQAATVDNVAITAEGASFVLNTEDLTGAARAPMSLSFIPSSALQSFCISSLSPKF